MLSLTNDGLKTQNSLGEVSTSHQELITTHTQDSSFAFESRLFFKEHFAPASINFNQDSLLLLQVNTSIENFSLKAKKLKDIGGSKKFLLSRPDYKKSHFTGHLLKAVHNEPVLRPKTHENWQVILLVVILFAMAALRLFYPRRFSMLWNAFRLKRFANQLFREENVLTQRISILLFAIFLLSASYFLFQANGRYGYYADSKPDFESFIRIFILFSGFILLKFIIHSIFGIVFKTQKEMSEYLFNMSIIQQIGGIGLFSLMAVQILGKVIQPEIILLLGAGTLLGMFVFQTYRGLTCALGTVSAVYFFLYFCALEILPLIWIFKIIIG
jgi:hypothetical protein